MTTSMKPICCKRWKPDTEGEWRKRGRPLSFYLTCVVCGRTYRLRTQKMRFAVSLATTIIE